ncbi:MAG: hypothetical protein GY796_00750 [Chloroflexi bacterium]|nr:hypothetical protein [Chloroflexota bacterium]
MMVENRQTKFKRPQWLTNGLIFLLFLCLSIFMTWPVAAQLGSAYAGGRGDLWVHQWTFWWIKEALRNGQNPFFTPMLYAPEGISLLSHNIAWLNIAFWLPLQAVVGSVVAYNIMFITIFALNGFGMYLFSREHLRHMGTAVIAGTIFGFWPYTMSHYDHPNMILLFGLPLTLLYLRRTLVHHRWRDTLLAGLFLALLGIGRWQLLLMSIPLITAYVVFLFVAQPSVRCKQTVSLLIGVGSIAALLMLPPALPLIQSQLQENTRNLAIEEPNNGRTDLLAYFIPPAIYNDLFSETVLAAHPLFGQAYELIAANVHYLPFIGFTVMLLALIGVLGQWRASRFWLLITLLYILLALGSQLVINGRSYLSWLPYKMIEPTLIGAFIRRPHRFNVILGLPLGMLAGWGAATLWQKIPSRWQSVRMGGMTAVLLLIFLLFTENRIFGRRDMTPYFVPAWYQELALDEEQYGLLDLPTNDRAFDKSYMSYQTTHGKPLAIGHVSRLPITARNFLTDIPFLATFLAHEIDMDNSIPDVSNQLRQLADGNIRYLVVHKRFIHIGFIDRWRDWLTVQPVYEDDELVAFPTDPQYGRDFTFNHPLTEEIGLIRAAVLPGTAVSENWIKVNTRWGSTAVPNANYNLCFDLHRQAETVTLSCQSISAEWPPNQWQASEVIKADYLLPVEPNIVPGNYDLTVQLTNESGTRVGETAVLSTIQIAANDPAATDPLQWQNGLTLIGHNATVENDTLFLDMFWQSDQQQTDSYVIFVHLVDTQTGQLAAQSDSIPQNWTYPTLVWLPKETILEQRTIPLQDVPLGEYRVIVGLYDHDDGERVTAVDKAGNNVQSLPLLTLTR